MLLGGHWFTQWAFEAAGKNWKQQYKGMMVDNRLLDNPSLSWFHFSAVLSVFHYLVSIQQSEEEVGNYFCCYFSQIIIKVKRGAQIFLSTAVQPDKLRYFYFIYLAYLCSAAPDIDLIFSSHLRLLFDSQWHVLKHLFLLMYCCKRLSSNLPLFKLVYPSNTRLSTVNYFI